MIDLRQPRKFQQLDHGLYTVEKVCVMSQHHTFVDIFPGVVRERRKGIPKLANCVQGKDHRLVRIHSLSRSIQRLPRQPPLSKGLHVENAKLLLVRREPQLTSGDPPAVPRQPPLPADLCYVSLVMQMQMQRSEYSSTARSHCSTRRIHAHNAT